MNETKLCKDCEHYSGLYSKCEKKSDNSVVTGEKRFAYCSTERCQPWLIAFLMRQCGETARYFKAKENENNI